MRPRSLTALFAGLLAAGCGSGPTVSTPTNVDLLAGGPSTATSTSTAPASATSAAAGAEPAAAPGVPTTLADGLQITVLKPGSGPKSKSGDRLRVQYVGTLADGTEFDSSRRPGRDPFEFEVGRGQVIKGWEEGMVGMQVGELRKLVVPSRLAYGDSGRPGIPGHATLTFEVELLGIE